MDCSSGSVICASITSELAPGYEVETVITGGSILGYSLTSRFRNPVIPKSTSIIESTIESTGLFIQMTGSY